ncbi:Na+/H+ antiporter NhaD [Pseudobutyrivibrio sp. NOR37]|uniref:Citrate transporter n=1 Tax=Pseudobutyrivibrio xylanivorans TaxID=185007 RepID=A0A6M0LGI8_PSEXY|nr:MULTISPECIES: SLC13 family permease [Pseudobutyrivibrio]NEX01652.1 citrate transporter [Pseudobutyrivibrio xylanivorans]SFR70768.1 Na+/H+ antiporter NhaD [Pseudobutyrivibrio sp. NOR37]
MLAEIFAVVIFVTMFGFIVWDRFPKHYVTLGCGALTSIFVFGVGMRSVKAFVDTIAVGGIFKRDFWYAAEEASEQTSGVNWATIIFLWGMMIMVEGMAEAGFFDWLCLKIAKLAHYEPVRIFVAFMVLSSVLAMFIDSITVILFLAAVTIRLARTLKFNPIPVIMAEIFCANLGGSATMCGDPPNIIIGTSLGYSFSDFVLNTGAIGAVSLVIIIIYFYFTMRNRLQDPADKVDPSTIDVEIRIDNMKEFLTSTVIFLIAVALLVTHAMTGLTVAFIGVFIAAITLITAGRKAITLLKRVDYPTLLFFIGLFIVVGGLEQTGILEIIAEFIAKVSGGNAFVMIAIILWVSAIASAFIDNIPFSATMIPVIRTLAATTGVDLSTMAWTLAIGTDIGGSMTPIGASANVVGISTAGKEGYPISWATYCKELVPGTIIVLVVSMISIYIRYL